MVTIDFNTFKDKKEAIRYHTFNLVWSQEISNQFISYVVSGRRCDYKVLDSSYQAKDFMNKQKLIQLKYQEDRLLFDDLKRLVPLERMPACIPLFTESKEIEPSKLKTLTDQPKAVGESLLKSLGAIQPPVKIKPGYEGIIKSKSWQRMKLHNHIEGFEQLCDKMHLYNNLKNMAGKNPSIDIFESIPLTFLITGVLDKELTRCSQFFQSIEAFHRFQKTKKDTEDLFRLKTLYPDLNLGEEKWSFRPEDQLKTIAFKENMWIMKPGENSNRGKSIVIVNKLAEIEAYVRWLEGPVIIQKYIENPLLYKGRKFDIRMFALITWVQGSMKLYFYQDGYVRTSSVQYDLSFYDREIHLTNEAIQLKSLNFGRHEKGNKLTLPELNSYLKSENPEVDFHTTYLPKMKVISLSSGLLDTGI